MRWLPALVAGVASAGMLVLYASLGSPDRPWRAVVVVALALAVAAVGYLGRRWPAIPLAVAAVAATIVLGRAFDDGPRADPGCTRECGLPLAGVLLLTLPIAGALSAAGVAARRLRTVRRVQNRTLAGPNFGIEGGRCATPRSDSR